MVLSWIEDIVSEYYRKTNHLVFNNIIYQATSPGKKQSAWQEFDILAVKDRKAKIVSCKRGLRPKEYNRQADMLHFHKDNLRLHDKLKKYRDLFSGPPGMILIIEYPRPEHVKRIEERGIRVNPLNDLLKEYVNLLKTELKESDWKEGKEKNYATRLLKALLSKRIIKVARQ